jgi:hypothetical protein
VVDFKGAVAGTKDAFEAVSVQDAKAEEFADFSSVW